VTKGKSVTTDSRREILGTNLGTEYSGVYVEGLKILNRAIRKTRRYLDHLIRFVH
jgi:hypothetical protein